MKTENFNFKLRRKIDPVIPILTLILSLFGLIMILSSSQFQATEATGNAYYFFIRQLIAWLIGVAAFIYFMKVPLESLYNHRLSFLVLAIFLLLLVFVPVIGPRIAGVHRWINLGFLRFQPAEVAKLLLILYFGAILAVKERQISSFFQTLLPFIVVLAVTTGLIILQPDMGTALIIIIASMTILFVAQANLWQYGALLIAGIMVLLLTVYAADYRISRLTSFLNTNTTQQDKLGSAYHGNQAKIAIGTGGLWGVGFGRGTSKYSFLPESHNDSIFAVIAEELGYIRTMILVLAYFYLAWRGYLLTRSANSRYVKLLSAGIVSVIIGQMLINVGGMLGLLPLTGVPLPLVSYGGTSLIVTMAMLGLLTNASRETAN